MAKSETVTIYPVPGFYIIGVPAVPTTLPTAEAAALVETGAFTYEPPQADEPTAAGDAAETEV